MKRLQLGTLIVYSSLISLTFACVSLSKSRLEHETLLNSDTPFEIEPGFHRENTDYKKLQEFISQIFKVVWNVPRNECEPKFGIDLNLDTYGIEANSAGTNWNGETITIFYNEQLGLYPAYEDDPATNRTRKINAGLPQLTNLTEHYEKATNDIINAIPNPEFSGLAVIDWEKWFPQWDFPSSVMNFYRGPSIDLVRGQHPDWDNVTVELVAQLEYEQSAKALMEGTLLLGQRLRPKGVWGYYYFPQCYYKDKEGCSDGVKKHNDDIPWLFRETTAFYPSIYIRSNTNNVSGVVQARIGEALRMRDAYGNPKDQPVFSYCRFNYTNGNLYYNLNTLNATILKSAEAGLAGAVIWGDHYDTHTIEACRQLQGYVRSALGPIVKQTIEAAANCSLRLCSGNGRCQGKILQCKRRKHNLSTGKDWQDNKVLSNNLKIETITSNDMNENNLYVKQNRYSHGNSKVIEEQACSCQCFSGWSGEACGIPSWVEDQSQR